MISSSVIRFPIKGGAGQHTGKLIRRKPLKHVNTTTLEQRQGATGSRHLTVCIAAIAEQSRAIVLVADRAVSMVRGGQTVLKADSGVRKIRELADGWAGLIAGPIDFGERVFALANQAYRVAAAQAASQGDVTIRTGMPESVKEAYQVCRNIEVVDRVLRPRLVDQDWYDKKVAATVQRDDSFFSEISKEISTFVTESVLLLCGFENYSPEIYLVCDPGVLHSESAAGFGVAGTGEDAAKSRLFTLETDPSDSLAKVLYDAYDAKDSCYQLLPEVGEEWDALVITAHQKLGTIVPDYIQESIEKIHKGHSRSPFDGRSVYPRGWRDHLQEFSEKIMSSWTPAPSFLTQRLLSAQRDS